MNASPNKTLHILAVLATLTFTGQTSVSQEQTEPVPLVTEGDVTTNTKNTISTEGNENISIGALDEIDVESIGLLDEQNGGFGTNMWEGSERAQIEDLLSRLPTHVRSPAAHELIKTLVLSTATAPTKDNASSNLLRTRLSVLADLGEFESFLELLATVPESARTGEIKKLKANVLLLMGDTKRACELTLNQVREADSLYWQKALFVCQLTSGETSAAALSLNLLREQLSESDAAFIELGGVSLGEVNNMTAKLAPSALNLTLLLGTDVRIPDHWLSEAGPAVQRAIAEAKTLPLTTRLVASEKAASMGALDPAEVGQLYRRIVFTREELEDAIAVAQDKGGSWGRALLHQASRQQQTPGERVSFWLASWESSLLTGNAMLAALVNTESLLTLPVSDQIAYASPQIIRALITIGDSEALQGWLNFLGENAEMDTEFERRLASLMPVIVISNIDDGHSWHPLMVERWWQASMDNVNTSEHTKQGDRLFMVLDALGHSVGRKGWDLLLSGSNLVSATVPNVGIRYSMQDAARSKQIGRTVLFALLAIGDGGPAEAGPLALGSVLRSLRHVGLDHYARALALEALIENGM